MRTEKEIKDLLNKLEDPGNDTFHVVVLKDVGIEELKTAKDVLRWVLQ